MIGVFPLASFCSILIFIFCLIISRYVSLSSIISSLVFPVGVYFFSDNLIPTQIIFSVFIPILLIATHQTNIERLLQGEENKINLFSKKSNKE